MQRDIRERTNTSEKGQGHNHPREKVKEKARARAHIQEMGTTTRTKLDTGQRTLGDFRIKRQKVEFVGDVQENDVFEAPRVDRAAYVFCVQKCKSVMMDSTELPSSSTIVFSGMQGSEEPASTHEKPDQSTREVGGEMIDQLLTLEVLCPRAQWIMRRQFRQRKSITV